MKHRSRRELIGDALHMLYVHGNELETLGGMLRDETEAVVVGMPIYELEQRSTRVRALTTQAQLTLTKAASLAERLETIAETLEPEMMEGGAS
jgi:hypothetical protein